MQVLNIYFFSPSGSSGSNCFFNMPCGASNSSASVKYILRDKVRDIPILLSYLKKSHAHNYSDCLLPHKLRYKENFSIVNLPCKVDLGYNNIL